MAQLQNFAFTGNPISEDVSSSATVTRTIKDAGNNTIATLTAEPFGGKARLQYDAIIRTLYKDGRTSIVANGNYYTDNAISCIAYINGTRHVFDRGVLQYGHQHIGINKIKTTLPFLRWFNGYELGIVFDADTETDYNVAVGNVISQSANCYLTYPNVVFVDLSKNPLESGGEYDGVLKLVEYGYPEFATFDKIRVIKTDVPAHPFYVRWVNDFGGYDYFMFACDQKRKRALTGNTYYEKNESVGVQTTLAKSANETIDVSSGMVDAQTFDALAHMPTSPDIRWFNESINAWVPVQISECNPEWMASQPTGEFLCSFVLPTPQINK